MKKTYQWQLKDIIMVAILALFFSVIYLVTVHFAALLAVLLTPFGLALFANELVFGIWFMAATLAAYIMQKAGVAIIAEMLAALLEVIMGNFYGPIVFVSGFLQGLGAELGFALFRYRRFDTLAICSAATGCCIMSFIWGFFRSGFGQLSFGILIAMFLVRLASSLIFAGLLMKICGDRLAKSGVLKSYPLGKHITQPKVQNDTGIVR
ncbi:ECF transporter S component [Zophobihabitans entericus]|uniref:ABC transporter permease n=1 Tax=Zophobihabitans entericus TaxID=1635327 RepID=A0A6G9ID17_9GAMM|nr:ECF transporter S component [Zophobihabitans entericus]QIQ21709.1 ABC transporter permease [Zophobihabitans entericus]